MLYIEEIVNKAESEMYESKTILQKGIGRFDFFSKNSDMLDIYTTLLFKDSDIGIGEATKCLHLIVECWNEI